MAKEVIVTADKLKDRKKLSRLVKISLLILLLMLIVIYIILQVVYSEGRFTVTLDPNSQKKSGLTMYESLNDPTNKRQLTANSIQFMDNISIKWIPQNINNEAEGSHNGQNYIAYTFYLENQGSDSINYWYRIVVDDVIKNVDKAARIMIYRNNDVTVYAKANDQNGEAEDGTVKFRTDEDGTIILEQRSDFNPGDLDKYTIVVWIEGDDPDCVDSLIGGELKMHMDITEEHIE